MTRVRSRRPGSPARSSRRRCRPPAPVRRRHRCRASSRVAPSKASRASSSPLMISALDAEREPDAGQRTRRGSPRHAPPTSRRTARLATSRSAISAAYSSSAANVRSSASAANTPVRSTPCPSRTIVVRRSTCSACPASSVEVGDQQPQRVGAAVDGRPDHGSFAARGSTHGPLCHHSGNRSSASSPSGLTPGPAASA